MECKDLVKALQIQYSECLQKAIDILQRQGHNKAADAIIGLRKTYGLPGELENVVKFKTPYFNEEELISVILDILIKRDRFISAIELRNLIGQQRINPYLWTRVINKLKAENKILLLGNKNQTQYSIAI